MLILPYLQAEKADSLKRADLAGLDIAAVAEKVRRKLMANYIYNVARSEDLGTLKFNVILENGILARSMCALEYRPKDRQVKFITFY